MIIWGGSAGSSVYYNDGARFNPATGSWTATSATGAPGARSLHSGVWTGNAMVVWGGTGPTGYVTDGGLYNPLANLWTSGTGLGAPAGRYFHTTVWTGSDVIVWAGRTNTGGIFLPGADGGRYNPVANAWTETTTNNAPAARFLHTAVWTGTEMIVWGGGNPARDMHTGGRYDPLANTWTGMNTNGVPLARESHTAVWTGSEMIVWGGVSSSGIVTNGGRYNPTSDSWTGMNTNGAPSNRRYHTAIWTGSEMLIWGGSGNLNTGARYNPTSNTWAPINTTGAPAGRANHTAVWTGTEMIIWGGISGSIYLNDGGRYNPTTDTWTPVPASTACVPGFPDDFVCRETLTGSNISFYASNAGATTEAGEPSHFAEPNNFPANTKIPEAGSSLWYSWTAPFSGGVIVTAASTNSTVFYTPCLAVYTGITLNSLTQVATNHSIYSLSRVAFNAVQGSNYLIAVAGTTASGSSGSGGMNLNLTLTPTPVNDFFTNRISIPSLFYETTGSFVGASREPGEPTHTNSLDFASWPRTLWWTWTAPTDLEVGAVPVKLTVEGIGFTANVGVYTGGSISNLTNVAATAQSGGLSTRVVSFFAVPGATYQIALGGPQHDPKIGAFQFGQFRFRLNVRALILSSSNLDRTNDTTNFTVPFGVNVQITNRGSADTALLRVKVTAILGNVLGPGTIPSSNAQVLLLTTNLPPLSPGQGLDRRINGITPPPGYDANTNETGYSVYAELQEQGAVDWATLDQTFLLVGAQSTVTGTGGGVIRLDAGLSGQSFNPLTNVSILGPLSANEGTVPAYYGRARYASGLQQNFTNTVWSSTFFSITNGLLKTGSVISNTPVGLTARYSSGGFIYSTSTNVVVLNLPPPTLALPTSLAGNFGLRIDGVAGRKHVIELANALSNVTVWLPLSTNSLDSSGLGNFIEPVGTNRQRFYRAREAE